MVIFFLFYSWYLSASCYQNNNLVKLMFAVACTEIASCCFQCLIHSSAFTFTLNQVFKFTCLTMWVKWHPFSTICINNKRCGACGIFCGDHIPRFSYMFNKFIFLLEFFIWHTRRVVQGKDNFTVKFNIWTCIKRSRQVVTYDTPVNLLYKRSTMVIVTITMSILGYHYELWRSKKQ